MRALGFVLGLGVHEDYEQRTLEIYENGCFRLKGGKLLRVCEYDSTTIESFELPFTITEEIMDEESLNKLDVTEYKLLVCRATYNGENVIMWCYKHVMCLISITPLNVNPGIIKIDKSTLPDLWVKANTNLTYNKYVGCQFTSDQFYVLFGDAFPVYVKAAAAAKIPNARFVGLELAHYNGTVINLMNYETQRYETYEIAKSLFYWYSFCDHISLIKKCFRICNEANMEMGRYLRDIKSPNTVDNLKTNEEIIGLLTIALGGGAWRKKGANWVNVSSWAEDHPQALVNYTNGMTFGESSILIGMYYNQFRHTSERFTQQQFSDIPPVNFDNDNTEKYDRKKYNNNKCVIV